MYSVDHGPGPAQCDPGGDRRVVLKNTGVITSAVGKSWKTGKNGVPTATNVVEFKLKDTGTKSLNGKVAMELSPAKYGADEWWLLLEPVES